VLDEARNINADTLVVYHPLIFRPLETLDFSDHIAQLAGRCIAQGLSVIVVHTALDNAPPGKALGDHLAAQIGLHEVRVLKPSGHEPLFKIVVWTPPETLENVQKALWDSGAGHIGNYEHASFRSRGTGTFRPLPDAAPYSGKVGELSEADEWRLEVVVAGRDRERAVRAMLEVHPYEEVAYDVYPLHNSAEPFSAARQGELPENEAWQQFARNMRNSLGAPGCAWFLPEKRMCEKSPVCPAAAPVT
jgi:hypothetical protein